jgi:hypothetical protein
MRHSRRTLCVTFAAILALGLAAPAAAQAEPADPSTDTSAIDAAELSDLIASDPEARFVSVAEAEEVFGVSQTEIVEPTTPDNARADSEVTPLHVWLGCDYSGKADWPHVTNNQASVHGYWVRNGGDCPSKNKVYVNLQALLCSSAGCTWRNQATDSGTFSAGSGTGYWATPHKTCKDTSLVGWRGEVEVDLAGMPDPVVYDYGVAKDLRCYPAA